MAAVTLKNTDELSGEIKEIIESLEKWVGDTVFARVMAHVPEPFKAFNTLYRLLLYGDVDSEIKELARLKLAKINDCHY